MRKKLAEIGPGYIDVERVRSATEEQIQAWKEEDGYGDFEFTSEARFVPSADVRAVRERLGLTQEQFAAKFRLSLRNIQEWEQKRKEPSEAARLLIYAISRDPKALERALRIS